MEEQKQNKLALVQPEDLSLINDNFLNKHQLAFILQRTPAEYVKQRPAKGGGVWNTVSGGYVRKCLNLMFGWDWDFEVVKDELIQDFVVVLGKLTVRANGKSITKTQYGRCEIKYITTQVQDPNDPQKRIKKKTDKYLDIGNDFKGACTDCLKKCASELGIAADIYNRDDFREVDIDDSEKDEFVKAEQQFYSDPPPPAATMATASPEYEPPAVLPNNGYAIQGLEL